MLGAKEYASLFFLPAASKLEYARPRQSHCLASAKASTRALVQGWRTHGYELMHGWSLSTGLCSKSRCRKFQLATCSEQPYGCCLGCWMA
jgi:hypothetical protein